MEILYNFKIRKKNHFFEKHKLNKLFLLEMLALFFFFFFFPPMIDRYPLNDLAGFWLHTEYEIRGK